MKLAQLFENQSVFGTMLLKLVKAGEPVFLSAKGRTFLSGNERSGYEAMRSHHKGWVIQADTISTPPDDPVDNVRGKLRNDVLHISSSKEYAMHGTGGTYHSSLFQFEKPIDDHYTIKKLDGTWTIIDRVPVTEQQVNDEEFMLKMAQRLAKKHGYEGEMSEKDALQFDYAGFTVLLFYQPDRDENRPWMVGWYKNGKLANPNNKLERFETMRMALADIFGYDFVKEAE